MQEVVKIKVLLADNCQQKNKDKRMGKLLTASKSKPATVHEISNKNDIYENLSNISKDKTLLLISHRLGVVRLCDKIIVLKKGHIIEQGNHDELMDLQGEYYKMFNAQKKFYRL